MIIQADKPVLEVHNLTAGYGNKPVLWSVDFSLNSGVLCGIIGPNGAGKSTLLKSIMGLLPVTAGYVRIFNRELKEVRRKISYVPQRESVDWDFPTNVYDVVMMGRYGLMGWLKYPTKADKLIVEEALDKVGMLNYAKRQISQLSGGQQQRVFLARALAQQAEIYFLDEPFAGVDIATENAIIELLREMRTEGKTCLVVHHDLQTATEYFDHLVLINMHLVASGPIETVFTAENLQKTYGGKLSVLSKLSNLVRRTDFPLTEG